MKQFKMRTSPVKAPVVSLLFCAACLWASVAVAEPRTIYVDQKVETSGDGTSWANAFKTIQEGVNDASKTEVDTVLVAPGEYGDSEGYISSGTMGCRYRVKIDRKLKLLSDKGRAVTHIVGCVGDRKGNADADGHAPIAGVHVTTDGQGSVVEGFTIRDCSITAAMGQVGPAAVGSIGSSSNAASNYVYVAYCAISNCYAQRASAMRGGTAIGTIFRGNESFPVDVNGKPTAATANTMGIYAYNCIFTGCGWTSGPNTAIGIAVNCSFVNNPIERGGTGGKVYNCVFTDNGKCNDANQAGEVYSCVYDGCSSQKSDFPKKTVFDDVTLISSSASNDTGMDHSKLVMSPASGDFRPVKGGHLDGKGKIEYTNLEFIPPDYKQRDFYGNRLADDAVIPAGVILPTATPVTKPLRMLTTDVCVNGFRVCVAGTRVQSDRLHEQVVITAAPDNAAPSYAIRDASEFYSYPRRDGTYLFMLRTADGAVDTLTHYQVGQVFYVDREKGLDTNDGSADAPFQSLQKAADSATDSGVKYIVYVAPGVYDNEYGTAPVWVGGYSECRARVVVTKAGSIRFVATDPDRSKTVIEGAYDPDHIDDGNLGVGPKALRCFLLHIGGHGCLSGFTLRKGRPTGETDDTDCRAGNGGGVLCSKEYLLVVQDCDITDCAGKVGSAGYFNVFLRCRLYDNISTANSLYNTKSIHGHSYAVSCLFGENPRDPSLTGPGGDATTWCSTLYTPNASGSIAYVSSARVANTILWCGHTFSAIGAGSLNDNICWGVDPSLVKTTEGLTRANPKLPGRAAGDFRPRSDSPVWEELAGEFTAGMEKYVIGDYNGDPLKFTADGKVVLGALHTVSPIAIPGLFLILR